jgi:uncharacterized protein YneF (UPF0154 family)
MRFPPDLDESYKGSWDAFLELRAVQDVLRINPLVVEDAFRLLLQQAGIRSIKPQFSVKRFITVNTVVQQLKRKLDLTHVLNHMSIRKHDVSVVLPLAKQINVIHRPTIEGILELKPRSGFTLDYLIQRMLSLKVFRTEVPLQLRPEGNKPTRFNYKERDVYYFYRDDLWSLSACRLRSGNLLLRYEVVCDAAIPAYKDSEKQIKNLWQTAIAGVF